MSSRDTWHLNCQSTSECIECSPSSLERWKARFEGIECKLFSGVFSLPCEEELLGEASVVPEVSSTKVSDLFWGPAYELIPSCHGFDDPRVYRKSFEFVVSEKQYAVCHFFSYTGKRAQGLFGGCIILGINSIYEVRVLRKYGCGFGDILCPESELTLSQ